MKRFKFLTTITVALCMVFFLSSCGSGGDEKTGEAVTDSTASTTTDATPVTGPEATADNKPFNMLIIKHKVANFAKWKTGYESHDSVRLSHGVRNFILGRGMNDSNMVLVMLLLDDVNKAKELTASKEMQERMQKAGVIGKPSIDFLDVITSDTSKIEQSARLEVTHKVKDWDAWKKEFDDHKQSRIDAGLLDRGVGYSNGDNHKVTIIFAVTDRQKADAFLKSQDLKDKMAKAGVEGQPSFLFYNIVQKY